MFVAYTSMADCEDLVNSPERPEPGDSMVQIMKNEEDMQSKTEERKCRRKGKMQVKEKQVCINGGGDQNHSDTILETEHV